MSFPKAWLDDVIPNPYSDQLLSGFRTLRFGPVLETEYRAAQQAQNYALLRISLCAGILFWGLFAVLDQFMIESAERWWMLAIRTAVLLFMLFCGFLLFRREEPRLLEPLAMANIAVLGIGAAAVVAIGHRVTPTFPYEGLLLIGIAGFFLVGLPLIQASVVSLLVLLIYAGLELLVGLSTPRMLNNLLFLVTGNMVAGVGCYLLEYKSREHFLIGRLLRLMADHDALTGLNNRRSFNRHVQSLWRQAQRDGLPLSLLLADVDHFKAYNDTYGHQAGDQALQTIAALFAERARRPMDMAVRLGGEEFALLFYGMAEVEAMQMAESLRLALHGKALEHRASEAEQVMTVSIGVVSLIPGEHMSSTVLYERADRALYLAKANGRNRVEC